MYQVWMPESKKITTVRIVDFILQRDNSQSPVETCDDEDDPEEAVDCTQIQTPVDDTTEAKEISETQKKKKVSFEDDNVPHKRANKSQNKSTSSKQITKGEPVKCIRAAGIRRRAHDVIVARMVARKRKDIISGVCGNKAFVLVAREMLIERKDDKLFPNMDGGDIVKDFGEARKPHIRQALKAMIDDLQEKRRTDRGKRSVRPNSKAPRNMAEVRARPDFKE